MKMEKLQCFLVFIILLLASSNQIIGQDNWECLSPCKCKWVSGKKTAECIRQNLDQIPSFLSSEIQYLDLTDNSIVHLHEFAFSQVNLVNLQKLTLKQCDIETIDRKAFTGLKIVIEIDLSGNSLRFIEPGTFFETHRLRVLLLNENYLESLENGLFDNLTYLQKVDLSRNRIKAVGEESFQNLPGLQTLLLNGNNITDLKLATFEKLPKLGSLELDNNPWNCNCFLKELRDWTIKRKLYTKQTTCQHPSYLYGKKWDEVSSDEFACQPKIQNIIPSSRQLQVESGESVRLDCLAVGIPQPQIHWIHRSRILNNSTRRHHSSANNGGAVEPLGYILMENTSGGGWVNLTVPNVTTSDRGEYICIAQSPGGSVEANVTLAISGDIFSGGDEEGGSSHYKISLPLASGLGVALLFLLLLIIALCLYYCRRRRQALPDEKFNHLGSDSGGGGNNDSMDQQQGFAELEKSLITTVNPIGGEPTTSIVMKPVRRYDTPSITSHGTEMTELNRTLLDNDSFFTDGVGRMIANGIGDINNHDDDDEEEDRINDATLELENVFHGTSPYLLGNNSFSSRQYPPDLLAFHGGGGGGRGVSPTSLASTAPDNSRLLNHYGQFNATLSSPSPQYYTVGGSGFKTLPHNKSGTPYSTTGGGSIIPALSRQGYVTIPRRPRAPSWSSGPPISPPLDIDIIEQPVYDNLGRRTTADGSSAISLNKTPELRDGCSRNFSISPSTILNNSIQQNTNNNNNVIANNNINSNDVDNVNCNNDNMTSFDRSAPEGAAECSLQLVDDVENYQPQETTKHNKVEKKVPPRPPPKPKKKHLNGPLYEDEDEDGTEV
ncbi:uncharacterized protein LOC122507643 [Leptopilina heterotoma]|uniref:uncharacterized protein LOC122507643 n=1 Tax=Leptopilina heterotoma TaxID=63436 RepID=UPI001CAA25A9|nr:uncharacterized protein LOC122507643 [Leptopilina heterotoma]XP_043476396.1 uncharacterized protein LOC122507643 [Leptopilina heterotoma]XP_043476397.1 uncharacterized protein LOC122507643 [Leptopilina heterotoma]